jgi:tetratricopeptide (TPR) repeat protein
MKFSVVIAFLFISSVESLLGQSAYVKLGQQALMDGDFKAAVAHLEKACVIDSTNANALWMLGYSYYHDQNYKKAITTYTKVLEIKPTDQSAYYFRALSKSYLSREPQTLPSDKEKNMLGAIFDLTNAIAIDPNDIKFYQNRGVFYREYGLFKLQKSSRLYDKNRGIKSLKASVNDLEKVLNENPDRKDLASLLDISKQQLTAANH